MKNRSETMKYKRIVFKVGTSSLTNEDGSLSRSKVKAITQQLAMLHEAGHEVDFGVVGCHCWQVLVP